MTEKLRQEVRLPIWVITSFISIIILLMGFLITVTASAATVKAKVETNTRDINECKVDLKIELIKKVNKDDYVVNNQRMYDILDRIETKVDNLKQ